MSRLKKINKSLYESVKGIEETDDFRVFFVKAAFEFYNLHDIISSKDDIDKACTKLVEAGDFWMAQHADTISIHGLSSLNIEPRHVYQVAAEIYSGIGDCKKSKEYYLKYYYFSNRIKVNSLIANKTDIILYSFRSYNEYSMQDLVKNEITCVHPSKMNDPFDSIACYICTPANLKEICESHSHIEVQSSCFKHFHIRSFIANTQTFENDDSIYFNKLMWSHYADKHKGFCIKYRVSSDMFVKYNDSDLSFLRIIPVVYTNKPVPIEEALNTDNSFAQKSVEWHDEQEVRLLHFSAGCDKDYYSIPENDDFRIEEVVFGYNCSKDAKQTIAQILGKRCNLSEITNSPNDIYTLMKKPYQS